MSVVDSGDCRDEDERYPLVHGVQLAGYLVVRSDFDLTDTVRRDVCDRDRLLRDFSPV